MPSYKDNGNILFHKEYRMLSFVPRWSIAPRLTQQSVAEHSFYVALYVSQLCDFLDVLASETVIIVGWALRHDAPEIWTSDPPGPAKRDFIDPVRLRAYIDQFAGTLDDFRVYRDASTAERFVQRATQLLKIADLIDEVMYLRFELSMGNVLVRDLYRFSLDGLKERLGELGEAQAEFLYSCVQRQLARIESEGALIPSLHEQKR